MPLSDLTEAATTIFDLPSNSTSRTGSHRQQIAVRATVQHSVAVLKLHLNSEKGTTTVTTKVVFLLYFCTFFIHNKMFLIHLPLIIDLVILGTQTTICPNANRSNASTENERKACFQLFNGELLSHLVILRSSQY